MADKNHRNNQFVGFSSFGGPTETRLTDIELVKRDLLNHLYTRRGERRMSPTFGSIIWEMLFEQLNPGNVDVIVDDVTRIVNSDPRTETLNVEVNQYGSDDHTGIRVQVELFYKPFNIIDKFTADFDRRSLERV